MTQPEKPIFIVSAGTGGHIFPGIALAEEAKKRGKMVFFLGRRGGMEEKIIKGFGFPFWGYHFFKKLISFGLLLSIIQCLSFLWRKKPRMVIACGSYASLPAILATLILGFPLYLMEQNIIPGKIIKLFSPFARCTFFGFPPAGRFKGKWIWTGNPIRRTIKEIREKREENILVLGGSQGARFLSLFFKKLALELPNEKFLIQVREEDLEKVAGERPTNCSFFIFTPDVREIFSKVKLVISRAGGSTISEILYLGLPAILIPYPYATQNHQEANARFLARRGGAVMIKESSLINNPEKVKEIIKSLLSDEKRRNEMGEKAKTLARDGAELILSWLELGRRYERDNHKEYPRDLEEITTG